MKLPLSACAFVMVLLIAGCKKDKVINISDLQGTYTGSFAYSNNNPTANYVPRTGKVTIAMTDKTYTSVSPFDDFSADAKGSYTHDTQQFLFVDSNVHTGNFDWEFALNGAYTFTTKGDSLFLTKHIGYDFYRYKLKKQQ